MAKQRWEESEKRREEKKREDQRRERMRRKKMQVGAKVSKSRFTVFVYQKRNNSARLPHFSKLTASKTKQFCEASFKKLRVECRADGLAPMRFAIFPFHLSKVLCLPRISEARSQEVLHLPRKIILGNLKI